MHWILHTGCELTSEWQTEINAYVYAYEKWSTYRLVFACLFVDCRCSHQRELLPLAVCFTHTLLVRNSQSQYNFTIVQYNIIMHLYYIVHFAVLASFPGSHWNDFITVYIKLHSWNLSGHGLVLQHFRRNEECGVLEELEPVDINLKYDFNYQVSVVVNSAVNNLPNNDLLSSHI